ncbi:GAF domain-like protein [Cylindrobasidium torrendii FP15055 ss-10]|uniref:GAF domain-like protein n=1 Tax=Cylindrobasidium torrendii FP15055 ss-10 TaxID=1314674 RepID=A0A0D7BJA1_9AGAR|nr:GAF domain-like protein [Cylindrobasidium torrendii FP15055 ss-10]
MPHADSSLVPEEIDTKSAFWEHVHTQLEALLDPDLNWVSNLSNTSSLVYHSLLAFPKFFGPDDSKAVNWCGFYLNAPYFPTSKSTPTPAAPAHQKLLLGPFCGKPACQFINVAPGKARGVCADAFVHRQTVLVKDVEAYPGHIACDGSTKSEIVVPILISNADGTTTPVGVLDLDCLALNGFDEDDQAGLEKIVVLLNKTCKW